MRTEIALVAMALLSLSGAAALSATAEEVDLSKYEKSVHSQFGEDGVIEKIFEIIEPTQKYGVEFGAYKGVEGNSMRRLVVEDGWGGLQIEGDPEIAAENKAAYAKYRKVKSIQQWVYPGNIEIIFEENGVPEDFDFLVIDIDSNDYYVWRAIVNYRPKLVMIEYNAGFPPPQRAVVDFHPMNYWDGTDYFGASIQSLYDLGKKKGYELVYANQAGNNLFFVDAKYYERFGLEDNSPKRFYRPPAFGLESGGRAPNGRGLPKWESRPNITWKELIIKKEFRER